MVTIKEYDKVKLKTGEFARIVEVYEAGVAYEAEIFRPNGEFSITLDSLKYDEIESVFKETEHLLAAS